MKETLLGRSPKVGAENYLPRESLGAGQRVHVHIDGVIHAIELNCLARGRLDDPRVAQQRGGMSADLVETIEMPGNAILRWRRGYQHQGAQKGADCGNYESVDHSSIVQLRGALARTI